MNSGEHNFYTKNNNLLRMNMLNNGNADNRNLKITQYGYYNWLNNMGYNDNYGLKIQRDNVSAGHFRHNLINRDNSTDHICLTFRG
jgi:hypothetical protein